MTAVTHEKRFDPSMAGALTGSMIFHVLVIFIVMVGLPYIHKDLPVTDEPVSVELVSPDNAPPPPKIQKSDKVVKERPPQNDTPPPQFVPRMPMPETAAPKPPKPEAPTPPDNADELAPPKPDQPPLPKKPEAKKQLAPKTPPLPKKRPEVVKKQDPKEQQEQFKSVLKNLLPDEAVQDKKSKDDDMQKAPPSPFAPKMSASEMDALRYQLSQCWKLMSGARYAEDLVVDIKLFMNPDRSVRDAQIVDTLRYNGDTYYRAAADSALRAVRNPRCSPLELPPAKYDLWKEMTVSFDPRSML
jgi:hypothetical protein